MSVKKLTKSAITLAALVVLGGACGSGTSTTSSSSDASDASDAFPTELVVSSPTATVSASSASVILSRGATRAAASTFDADADYLTKKTALATMLAPATLADCAFIANFSTNTTNASCYGPELTYTNHPGGASKDADTTDIDGENSPMDTDGDGSLPTGDLGIWRSTVDGSAEACAAGQMNAKIGNIAAQLDSAMLTMASMVCTAIVNGETLPAEGDTLDLTTDVSSSFSANDVGLTVSSATLARNSNTTSGNHVYVASLTGTGEDSLGNSLTLNVRLKHIPTAALNATYEGKLSYSVASTATDNVCGAGAGGQKDAVSIAYSKASSTSLTYQLQSAHYCGTTVDPYESATDFTVAPDSDWQGNFNVALFNINPSNGTGDFQFAWQAGPNDDATRVMNLSLAAETSTVSGCAYFGYGPTVETGAGEIDKMICNWAGPQNDHDGVSKAQRQCIELDATSGLFTVTSSNITYAPTNSCDSDGTDGSGNQFSYIADVGVAVTGSVTNDLIDLADLDVTAPTAPTNVDL